MPPRYRAAALGTGRGNRIVHREAGVPAALRRALEQDELLTSLASARAELLPQARAQGIYTDEDVFAIVS
jgi:hypothetical protein